MVFDIIIIMHNAKAKTTMLLEGVKNHYVMVRMSRAISMMFLQRVKIHYVSKPKSLFQANYLMLNSLVHFN